MMRRMLIVLLLLLVPSAVRAETAKAEIRIGVAAINGKEDAGRSWKPLGTILEAALPGTRVSIVPMTYGEVVTALKTDDIHFLLTGPTYYVDFEVRYGISRLATVVRSTSTGHYYSLGGVVAVKANRKDLVSPTDLPGKTIAGTDTLALGGWLAPMHELKLLGIGADEFKHVSRFESYEEALLAALEGRADAAFLRTGVIEKMIKDGRIAASEVRVLRFASAPIGFPEEISTRAYPEWAFAKTLPTPDELAKRVAIALLSLPENTPLKASAGVAGFTVPLDYAPVHDLLRSEGMGPYAIKHGDNLFDLLKGHGDWAAGGAILLLLMSAGMAGMASVNRRLAKSRLDVLKLRDHLEHTVAERTRTLEAEIERRRQAELDRSQESSKIKDSLVKTVRAVALTVEMRDPYMSGHQQRVATLAAALADEMALSPDIRESVYLAGLVHDIGMVYVPSEITNRPGRLSDLEFEIVKSHPRIGYEIMSTVDLPWPIAEIVLNHHRRLDGSGYPEEVEGEIPLEARILGVADVVEAMCSHRPYRPTLGIDKALAEIESGKASKYDPEVVEACNRLFKEKGFNFQSSTPKGEVGIGPARA